MSPGFPDVPPGELAPGLPGDEPMRPLIEHPYTSTYCLHGVHERCRLNCKLCNAPCRCDCHVELATRGLER